MKLVVACCLLFPAVLRARQLKIETAPGKTETSLVETAQAFDCLPGAGLMGINLRINLAKSLQHSLTSGRESVSKPRLVIPKLPAELPRCGEPVVHFSAAGAAAARASAPGEK